MKYGRSLNEVAATLAKMEDEKRDFIVPAPKMKMSNDAKSFYLGDREELSMSDLFHSQLGSSLNIPAKYYGMMQENAPELLAENVNTWLSRRDNSYMIRTLDRNGRAFLSDRYRRIDNLAVASATLPLFVGKSEFHVESCEVTDSRLYLKIVNEKLTRDVTPGDKVQMGVMISNSEVGLGAVVVCPLIYRLVCTNGMVVNDLGTRKRHVGRRQDIQGAGDYFTVYSDETIEAEDKAFMLRLRDSVLAAMDEARFDMIVGRLKNSTQNKITGRVTGVVELAGKTYGMSMDEGESVLKYLIEGGDLTQYGLANAVTRTAADAESYDRATVLEAVGWEVASAGEASWKMLNAA